MSAEEMAAHRRTAQLAYDSMVSVDRRGWTDEQWIADAQRLMDHIDGSAACLLNGHVGAMLRAVERQAYLVAEAEERGAAKVRARVEAAARHPYKGPNDTDASMLRSAAARLRGGFEPGGSWTKQTVADVIEAVAALIDPAALTAEADSEAGGSDE